MITFDTSKLRNAVGFTVKLSAWGNRRKADMGSVTTDADKKRMRLTKELVIAKEYDDIKSFFGELRGWVYSQTVPSFFREGFQLTSPSAVDAIEKRMKKALTEELPLLVDKLIAVYPVKIDEAKVALGSQFNQADYPTVEKLRSMFNIEWNWIAFTVPDNIPEELRKAEGEKLQKQMQDAGEQITLALRVGFQELISHALERLTPGDDGKPRVFRNSLLENIQEFIDTFSNRNLLGDNELQNLVNKAQEILIGIDPDDLRKNQDVRKATAEKFASVKLALDGMVETVRGRRFSVDAE